MKQVALPALLLLSACMFEPPAGAQLIEPPAEWRAVWETAQACSGLEGDFSELHFYVVPVADMPTKAGETRGHDIYIREDWQIPFVVKHEMIHALGIHDHPRIPFATPCHATWETMNDA